MQQALNSFPHTVWENEWVLYLLCSSATNFRALKQGLSHVDNLIFSEQAMTDKSANRS